MSINARLLASQTKPFVFTGYVRIIPSVHVATPLGCAPSHSRFGGTKSNFAVLYAARDLATALAETVIRDRFEGLADRRLFVQDLDDRVAVQLQTNKPLRVVDLRQGGCLKLGVSTDITGAKNFVEAQQFAQDVYDTDATIDGIQYASRLTGETCVAVFDRAIGSQLEANQIAPLTQIKELGDALDSIEFKLIR